jgi:glutamyl-tRNA synthetase
LRPPTGTGKDVQNPGPINWRFRVTDGETVAFEDGLQGHQSFVAGRDFGDFLVWRRDGFPSYELAVVADDIAMGITEVIRGADLLLSTARQILLYRAFQEAVPIWMHAPLVLGPEGKRLAKREGSLSLRGLRAIGRAPEDILTAPISSLIS